MIPLFHPPKKILKILKNPPPKISALTPVFAFEGRPICPSFKALPRLHILVSSKASIKE